MAITKSAKKAIRNANAKRVFNLRRQRRVQTAIKEINRLIEAGKIDDAEKKLSEAYKAIDKASKMNTLKKNTASRKKSRLATKIRKARG